jgi:TolB-like protein
MFLAFEARSVFKGEIKMRKMSNPGRIWLFLLLILVGCAAPQQTTYVDPNMDFGAIQTVAVMPFTNLARDPVVPERVRDVFINKLLATGAIYVLPPGEVARGVARAEIAAPTTPSPEEVVKLGGIIKVQAIFTGVVREYGEVRSGATAANAISVSLQMIETQTGKVVWTASSTKGGITIWDRLFGGGGRPMNVVTEEAVNDLLAQLFK